MRLSGLTPEQKKERQREQQRRWRQAHPGLDRIHRHRESLEKRRERQRRKDARRPEKIAAMRAVREAIVAGRLFRGPCIVCGSEESVEGHHFDYSMPLVVMWLCQPCHRDEHRAHQARKEPAKAPDLFAGI